MRELHTSSELLSSVHRSNRHHSVDQEERNNLLGLGREIPVSFLARCQIDSSHGPRRLTKDICFASPDCNCCCLLSKAKYCSRRVSSRRRSSDAVCRSAAGLVSIRGASDPDREAGGVINSDITISRQFIKREENKKAGGEGRGKRKRETRKRVNGLCGEESRDPRRAEKLGPDKSVIAPVRISCSALQLSTSLYSRPLHLPYSLCHSD